jgi:hypothetical protein
MPAEKQFVTEPTVSTKQVICKGQEYKQR